MSRHRGGEFEAAMETCGTASLTLIFVLTCFVAITSASSLAVQRSNHLEGVGSLAASKPELVLYCSFHESYSIFVLSRVLASI